MRPLDALRGIAAMSVVFFHFTLQQESYNHIFRFGATGVDLFFIISGFVIFMSLQKADSLGTFFINRFSRLYPTYWMGVLFSFAIISIHFHFSQKYPIDGPWVSLAGNLTMFQYYLGIPDLEGPYWTMNIEMLFYILMGIILTMKSQRIIVPLGIAICSVLVIAAFNVDQNFSVKEVFMKIPLLYHFPLFFAGIVFFKKFEGSLSTRYFLFALTLAFVAQMALFPHTWRACKHITQGEYVFVLALFFGAFLLFLEGKLEWISNPITLFLGKISFPLYLTHQYLSINLIIPYFMWKHELSLWQAALFIALPASVAIATLIHYTAEIHLSKWIKTRLLSLRSTWPSPAA